MSGTRRLPTNTPQDRLDPYAETYEGEPSDLTRVGGTLADLYGYAKGGLQDVFKGPEMGQIPQLYRATKDFIDRGEKEVGQHIVDPMNAYAEQQVPGFKKAAARLGANAASLGSKLPGELMSWVDPEEPLNYIPLAGELAHALGKLKDVPQGTIDLMRD